MYRKSLNDHSLVYFAYAPPMSELDSCDASKRPKKPLKDQSGWESNVFYYWWLFLRENAEYRETCENGGIGPKSALFSDFGNIYEIDFVTWWKQTGRELFREPHSEGVQIGVGTYGKNRIEISVPMTGDLERCMAEIRALLQPALQIYRLTAGPSQALYPVARKPVLSSLHKIYQIYTSIRKHPSFSAWQIFDHLELSSAVQSKESQASSVSRALKQANFLIEQVGNGYFPVSTQDQLDCVKHFLETRERWKIDNFGPQMTPMRQRWADSDFVIKQKLQKQSRSKK